MIVYEVREQLKQLPESLMPEELKNELYQELMAYELWAMADKSAEQEDYDKASELYGKASEIFYSLKKWSHYLNTRFWLYWARRNSLKRNIDQLEDEIKRQEKREELVKLARNAMLLFQTHEEDRWRHLFLKGEYHKYLAIILKSRGEYESALEHIREAIQAYEQSYSRKGWEHILTARDHSKALETEIRAQRNVISGDLERALECYKEASQLYNRVGDRASARWCRALYELWSNLHRIIIGRGDQIQEGRKGLHRAISGLPEAFRDELKSLRTRLLRGAYIPEDKKLMLIAFSLVDAYQREIDKVFTAASRFAEDYIRLYFEHYEGFSIVYPQERRKIDLSMPDLTDEDKKLLRERGGVVEIDILGYKETSAYKCVLLLGEVKKTATIRDIKDFLMTSYLFEKRWRTSLRLQGYEVSHVERIFICLEKCPSGIFQDMDDLIVLDKESLKMRMKDHSAPDSMIKGIDNLSIE